MTTTFIRKCILIVALSAALAGPVFAQFAFECYPPTGRSYISKTKCPEGMTWREVQTDPYYIDRRASTGQSTSASGKNDYERIMAGETVLKDRSGRGPNAGIAATGHEGDWRGNKPLSLDNATLGQLRQLHQAAILNHDGDAAAAAMHAIKHRENMEIVRAGGSPTPDPPEQRTLNCMPNGFGGFRCR